MNFKSVVKAGALLPLAGMLMGNQSCQQEAPRELKKIVEIDRITSQPLLIPGGPTFDFQYVANEQAAAVFMESQGFALRNSNPITVSPAGVQTKFSATDQVLFSKYVKRNRAALSADKWSIEASCMVNLPMARIRGSVNSFEMLGGGGISIGFSPAGPLGAGLSLGSANFQLEYAQMDMSMRADHPITNNVMQATNVTANQTKTRIGLGINLGMFSLGPSFYYQTPLASVTKSALGYAVSDLKEKLQAEPWHSRVIANHDTHLTVFGGRNVNMVAGDQLAIYNEIYYWDGEPCASTYRGGAAVDPVAIIQIEAVGDEISMGKIIMQTDNNSVIGAKATVYKLYDPKAAQQAAGQ